VQRSLTVLLPVCNVQSTLTATVQEILEVASDLADQFELMIIDDGSADATSEVAHDLSRDFPQVHALRHGQQLGREAAIRTGLNRSSGEVILLCDHATGSRNPRHDGVAMKTRVGYHMIDRRTMERVHRGSRPGRPNYLGLIRDTALGE